MKPGTIADRITKGWTVKRALTQKIQACAYHRAKVNIE